MSILKRAYGSTTSEVLLKLEFVESGKPGRRTGSE